MKRCAVACAFGLIMAILTASAVHAIVHLGTSWGWWVAWLYAYFMRNLSTLEQTTWQRLGGQHVKA